MKKWAWPLLGLAVATALAQTQAQQPGNPLVSVNLGDSSGEAASNVVQIFVLLTVLSLAPAIMIMATSFTRLSVVFYFLRQALGTQNVPSNQLLAGMAMIMTFFIMAPTFREIKANAYDPMSRGEITLDQAFEAGADPLKRFMLKHTREKDLALFVKLSGQAKPATRLETPLEVLTPAFIISELKTAFEIGFLIFVPFLIVDLVVASILLAMGMMMLPPILISLPFKILLFIMVDGWHLLVSSMMQTFS